MDLTRLLRLSIKEQASDLHHSKKSLVNQREVRRDTLVEEGLVTLEAAREEAVFSPKKI